LEASVRAGTAQDSFAFLDGFQPGLRGRVVELMGAEATAALTDPPRTAWIAIEDDVVFVNTLVELLGEEGTAALVRASVSQHFEGALLANLVSGARRLFGMTPLGLIKMVPRAWSLVYRGFGKVSLKEGDRQHAVVLVDRAHPLAFTAPGYLATWRGIFAGIVDATGEGDPEAPHAEVVVDPEFPRFEIRIDW
jgi:hypothetical protein